MSKATDKELGSLHRKLAQVMSNALGSPELVQEILSQLETSDLDDEKLELLDRLERASTVNPALLQAIARFLKDNEITCAVEDSEELSDLQKRLNEKKNRKQVGNVVHLDD